jgi:hypothetical protein
LDAILVPEENTSHVTAFEVDGEQHFRAITPYFKTWFSQQFKNDLFKTIAWLRVGWSLVRWPRHTPLTIDVVRLAVKRSLQSLCIIFPAGDTCYRPLTLVLQYIGVIRATAEETPRRMKVS